MESAPSCIMHTQSNLQEVQYEGRANVYDKRNRRANRNIRGYDPLLRKDCAASPGGPEGQRASRSRQEDIDTIRLLSCLKKTGMPLQDMQPFLAVSADADPADYPELVEHLRNHRENIVSQISSLQQVVDFIDMKLEQGKYRRDCSDKSEDKSKPKNISPVEMSYFSGSAKMNN